MNVVIEIGGTYARFAAFAIDSPGTLHQYTVAPCDQFVGVAELVAWYLNNRDFDVVDGVCLAIAGPSGESSYTITNRDWTFDLATLGKLTSGRPVEVINDFEAVAYSVRHLNHDSLEKVREGTASEYAPKLVLGPGTGLGMALLFYAGSNWHVLPTEAGNIGYAPAPGIETEVLLQLQANHRRVIVEDLLSGSGLVSIYEALCTIRQVRRRTLCPASLTRRAKLGDDDECVDAIRLFCDVLGDFTGDMVLATGATGGVYLSGGILPRIREPFQASGFEERFSAKRKLPEFVANTPIWLVTGSEPALLGANRYLTERLIERTTR